MQNPTTARVLANPLYHQLVRERRVFATILTAIMLVVYYGFILLVAFAPGILGEKIGSGVTTLGLPLGAAIIVIAILLTAVYVWRANGRFDALTRELSKAVQS